PVRALAGQTHPAGLLVADGDPLRPPPVDAVLGGEPVGDLLVRPARGARGVEQPVPLLTWPAGPLGDRVRPDELIVTSGCHGATVRRAARTSGWLPRRAPARRRLGGRSGLAGCLTV